MELLPTSAGVVAIDDPWFSGGYGVYETLKCREGLLFFPDFHQERLLDSARLIGLEPLGLTEIPGRYPGCSFTRQ
jgi:branched-subunit amino acid aminotransferase/4-amino-4-deoxychorismate lyase